MVRSTDDNKNVREHRSLETEALGLRLTRLAARRKGGDYARERKPLQTWRWMLENGLKWDKKKVLVVAMENRNVDMAELIMMQEEEEEVDD